MVTKTKMSPRQVSTSFAAILLPIYYSFLIVVSNLDGYSVADAFTIRSEKCIQSRRMQHPLTTKIKTTRHSWSQAYATKTSSEITVQSYSFRDWKLTYRLRSGNQMGTKSTVIMIHPVGVGIDSWFWTKLMDCWEDPSCDILAPDLIGCGMANGGDVWDPMQRALSFPLGWVQGIEPLLPDGQSCCTVIVQGGLAPVGLLLAARNPTRVNHLIFCSPPTDLMTAVPPNELERNLAFLTNPFVSQLAFGMILEQSWALRFFSNAFLFATPCDEDWIVTAQNNTTPLMRPAIAAFNAGMCQHRSFETELRDLSQRILILTGEKDRRDRQSYVDVMDDCTWIQVPNCCNVLPWEDPEQVYRIIQHFLSKGA